jgi:bifunctional chitinase/lysozyme
MPNGARISIALAALLAGLAGCPDGITPGMMTENLDPADGDGATASNLRPIADAGESLTVRPGERVVLDGTASRDPDGDRLQFTWQQLLAPGLDIPLSGAFSSRPQFIAPSVTSVTILSFELFVSDGRSTASDVVAVTVEP